MTDGKTGQPDPGSSDDTTKQSLREKLTENRIVAPSERTRPAVDTANPAETGGTDYVSVKSSLHARLLNEVEKSGLLGADEEEIKKFVQQFVDRVLSSESLPLNENERRRLAADLTEETLGVGPLAPLMLDPAVTDIMVNRYDAVYVEKFGQLEKTNTRFRNAEHLTRIIQRLASRVGRRIDESSPMVDARLPDGSRINATLPPVSIDGPTLSIRRFGKLRLTCDDLLGLQMFSEPMRDFVQAAIVARKNILVSGGPGAGKSTFLSAMAEGLPAHERIITIEDAAELNLRQKHVIRFETRSSNIEGQGAVTTRQLVNNALRMRPDRIIVGEVRGPEALDMLQAMNTGHDGGLTTIHASSPRDAITRLETMVLMAGLDLPQRAIREQIVSAISLVVHIRRFEDGVRRVQSIVEITGQDNGSTQTQEIFRFERGHTNGKKIEGRFAPTGIVPRIMEDMQLYGTGVSNDLFSENGKREAKK